jgi:hypothetical protein
VPQDAQLGVEFEYQSLLSAYRHLAVPLSPAVALLFSIELGIDIAGDLGGELLPQPQGGFILRLAKPQQSVRPEEARRLPRRRWPLTHVAALSAASAAANCFLAFIFAFAPTSADEPIARRPLSAKNSPI